MTHNGQNGPVGLVLEGGGAKGAFHAGAYQAMAECGLTFDGVMGTSVGAVNGAMIAQGNVNALVDMWHEVMPSTIMDVEDEKIANLVSRDLNLSTLSYLVKLLGSVISKKGFSTEKAMAFLRKYINENKVRASRTDFGLITLSLTGKIVPMEVFKADMPEGTMHDFIMASSYLPFFRQAEQGKRYFDGGLFDNLPINPLIHRGYADIYAVRTGSNMPKSRVIDPTVNVHYINPSEPLGGTVTFTKESILHGIKLGYHDANRVLKGMLGANYYFHYITGGEIKKMLLDFLASWQVEAIKDLLDLPQSVSIATVFQRTVELTAQVMETEEHLTDAAYFIRFIEMHADDLNLEKFKVYDLREFWRLAKEAYIDKTATQGKSLASTLIGKVKSRTPEGKLEELYTLYMSTKFTEVKVSG